MNEIHYCLEAILNDNEESMKYRKRAPILDAYLLTFSLGGCSCSRHVWAASTYIPLLAIRKDLP